MSKTERQRVQTFVEACQPVLYLSHWLINVSKEPLEDEEDSYCTISLHVEKHSATISLAKEWDTYKDRDKRHYIIHELVHCYTGKITDPFNNSTAAILTLGAAHTTLKEWMNDRMETATDDLARVVSVLCPLYPSK